MGRRAGMWTTEKPETSKDTEDGDAAVEKPRYFHGKLCRAWYQLDQKNEEEVKCPLVTDGHSAPNSPKAYSVKQTRAFQHFPFASRYKVKVCQ